MGAYLLSLICAAMLSSLLMQLVRGSPAEPVIRLVCGVFLASAVLSPLPKADLWQWVPDVSGYYEAAKQEADRGQAVTDQSIRDIINGQVRAYILDKAQAFGASVEVEVELSEGAYPVPVKAILRGRVSEPVKARLQRLLQEELGIAKEDQLWIGAE